MKVSTGVAFLLVGAAYLLLFRHSRATDRAALALAVVTGCIGGFSLLQYATGWDSGIDNFLFGATGRAEILHPWRMSPGVAANFVLIAGATGLICGSCRCCRFPRVILWLGLVVVLLGVTAVLGHLVGFHGTFTWWSLNAMQPQTALVFILTGSAIFVHGWLEAGVRWVIGLWFTLGFGMGLLLLMGAMGLSAKSTIQLIQANEEGQHACLVIAKILELDREVEASVNRLGAYIITGDKSFLTLPENSVDKELQTLAELTALTLNNEAHRDLVAALRQSIVDRIKRAHRLIDVREKEGFEPAAEAVATRQGENLMDDIRRSLDRMTEHEMRSLTRLGIEMRAITERTFYALPLSGLAGALLLAVALLYLNLEITARNRALRLLNWEKEALEIIMGRESVHDVLESLMISLEQHATGALCSVLLLDSDGIHLRRGAAPGLPEAYNRAIEGVAIGPSVGSCGTAIYEKRQVIVTDIASDPLWADFRDLALSHQLAACWSTPIPDREGKIVGSFAIYYHHPRDPTPLELELIQRAVHITSIAIERKKTEEEIRRLTASLERRVSERTNELERTVRELESFSYSIAHDLRAPLRAIDGYSRLLVANQSEYLEEDARRMLGIVSSEALRMGRLIDDLLAFSGLVRQPTEPETIDMRAMAKEVFEELMEREQDRKVRLELHPLPAARGTKAMIRQVWVNLIGNAIKFTKDRDDSGIEIGSIQDRETVYFVKDNGTGFDMNSAGKLFGIFERLENAKEFSGTGIGLALVKRIIQRHGGRVWAEAEPGRGARFFFTLPETIP
ncbi:MAG: sensor histidine kinase [Terrimicrobiaceae bacterium]